MAGSILKEAGLAKTRRSEMTPERVVDLDVGDDGGDATRSGMSKEVLERALKAAEISTGTGSGSWRPRLSGGV
eukprot:3601408-Rhodomonas_salina.1